MKSSRIAIILFCSIGLVVLLIILFETKPIYANSLSVNQGLNRDDVKIEQQVLDDIAVNGQSDFIVRFREQADLSPAYALDWKARGEFVYKALNDTAKRSQAKAIALLRASGLEYHTFIAGNELYVKRGSLAMVNGLSQLSEVVNIRALRTFYVDPIIENRPFGGITWAGDLLSSHLLSTVGSSTESTLDWGIADTNADQFWPVFGQGEGIVVANIDTGVQWDHPALIQAYKCGTDASDPSCWEDPSDICDGEPCDNNGHGTHTMGTMVGDDDQSLTYSVGMAPGAQWIACKGCEDTSCSEYALNSCADWILAPDGDPANRPNIVNNSWGGSGGDSWYQAKVQAWVASGIFPAFAAGNTGPSCSTLNSPGDYQESFSAAAHDSSRTIAFFSSAGPGVFGHDPYTKPNISAPGASICSSVPTDSWSCAYDGTSMASPHVAGAVSLLWSCNPSLIGQVEQTFGILQDSAATPLEEGNCGAPPDGDGNYTYGYGLLDVYNAGETICNTMLGSLNGFVHDDLGDPISGVNITANLNGRSYRNKAITDSSGYYTMALMAGSYAVTAEKVGFTSQTINDVAIEAGLSTPLDINLTANGWVYGQVTDEDTGFPVAQASITAEDGSSTKTDNAGYYSLGLNPGIHTLTASAPGYTSKNATVSISSRIGTPQDFIIQVKVKFDPEKFDISIAMGSTGTFPATIINHQASDYEFTFLEKDQGFTPLSSEVASLNIMAGPDKSPADSATTDIGYHPRPASSIALQGQVNILQTNVLLLKADDDSLSDSPIRQDLLAYGDLGAVDIFDAGSATPTLPQLEAYDVVVVWSFVTYPFADATALGNVLADYVDAGGKVIDMMYAFYSVYGYGGRFRTGGYSAMTLSSITITSSCLGIYDEDHPIMAGITNVCDAYRGISGTLTPGSYEVARWQDNELFVAVKENRSVASINGYPGIYSGWTGQMDDVLHNAILYLDIPPDVPWLSEEPISATVSAQSSLQVSILFNASANAGIMQPGEYEATLVLDGDLDQPDVNIPITMTVTAPSNYGILQGTVRGLGHCNSNPGPLAGATLAVEGGISVETDENGNYKLWLPAGPYTITATSDSHTSDLANVEIYSMGQVTVQDFNLYWEQPCLQVAPTIIFDTLLPGAISTQILDINNDGSGNLEYDFTTINVSPQLLLHLDDPVGATVFLDSSGNSYNGSCSGTSCPIAGVVGRQSTAVQFDGTNDLIQVPSNPGFDLIESQGKLTIAAWVNINNWSSGWFPIIDKNFILIPMGWSFQYSATGGLYFTSLIYEVSCPYTMNLHEWYHLGLSYDQPAGQIRFYVNGSQVCEHSFSQPLATPGQPVTIGYSATGGYGNGIIDELIIFSEALSAGDVRSLYLNGYTTPTWLSVTPISGTVPAGGGVNASVTLDASDLSTGIYSYNLSLTSNDPITTQIFVPVTLVVVVEPPEVPSFPNPEDDEVYVPVSQGLSWQASPHAEAYDLYLWELGETKPTVPTVSDLSQANYDPPDDLLTNVTYAWQVIAKNAAGFTPGPEWSFSTGEPTSVRLAGFSSTVQFQGVQLDWQSAQEVSLIGFNLLRSESLDGNRIIINQELIPGINPGKLHGNNYQYLDNTVEAGKTYYYWIEWVEISRSFYFGPVLTDIVPFNIWLPLSVR